jgi:hypothetical protein
MRPWYDENHKIRKKRKKKKFMSTGQRGKAKLPLTSASICCFQKLLFSSASFNCKIEQRAEYQSNIVVVTASLTLEERYTATNPRALDSYYLEKNVYLISKR